MSEEDTDTTADSDLVDALEVPSGVDDTAETPTDQPTDEQVTETQETVEPTATAPQTEPTTEPAKPTPQHDFDKGLQKLQQELAAQRRANEEFQKQFQEYMQRQNQPAPKPSKLDELLAKDDYDVDPNLKAVAAQLREVDGRLSKSSEPVQQLSQQLQQLQIQQWNDRFERQYGFPADDVFKVTDEQLGGKQASPDLYDYLFTQNAERIKAERTKPADPAPERKPSTQPDKSTEGTRITQTKPSPPSARRFTATGEIPDELVDNLIKEA